MTELAVADGSWAEVVAAARDAFSAGLETGEIDAARASYLEAVDRVTGLLHEQDGVGRWWSPGLLASCDALADTDHRFAFCRALPRSALFGETVVVSGYRAGAGDDPPEAAKEAGRLVNMFVTTLDGICDEAPELLPEVVPATNDLFASFPAASLTQPSGRHPVVWLTYEVAVSAVSIIREQLSRPEAAHIGERLTEAVRAAYRAEIESLTLRIDLETSNRDSLGEVLDERTRLSKATFNASLQIGALFARCDDDMAERLAAAAARIGAFFGWVDDLVDLELDSIQRHPNMVAALLIKSGCELGGAGVAHGHWRQVVVEETQGRWRALCGVLRDFPQSEAIEEELCRAGLAWLGFAR